MFVCLLYCTVYTATREPITMWNKNCTFICTVSLPMHETCMINHRESADTKDTERSIYDQNLRFETDVKKPRSRVEHLLKFFFKGLDPHLDLDLHQAKKPGCESKVRTYRFFNEYRFCLKQRQI